MRNLCAAAAVPENTVRRVEMAGLKPLAVYNWRGNFYVTNDICTHGNVSLSSGHFDTRDGVIECPLHGGAFDVRSGAIVEYPCSVPLKTYRCHVKKGRIFADLGS